MSESCNRPPTAKESEEILQQLKNSEEAKKLQSLIDQRLVENDLPPGSIQVFQSWSECNFDIFNDNEPKVEPDCLPLPIEDFALFGPTPHEPLVTVECQLCQKNIKITVFSQHLAIQHPKELKEFYDSLKSPANAPLKTRLVRVRKENTETIQEKTKGKKVPDKAVPKKPSKPKQKNRKRPRKKSKSKSPKKAKKSSKKTAEPPPKKEKLKTKIKIVEPKIEVITIDDDDSMEKNVDQNRSKEKDKSDKNIKSSANSATSSKTSDAKQLEEKLMNIVGTSGTSGQINLPNKTDGNQTNTVKKPVFTRLKGDYCGGKITKANQVQPSSSPAAIYSAHPSIVHNSVFKKPYPVAPLPSKDGKQANAKSAKTPINSKQTLSLQSMEKNKSNVPGVSEISANNSVVTAGTSKTRNLKRTASTKVSAKLPEPPKMSFAEKFNVQPGLFQKLCPELAIKDSAVPTNKDSAVPTIKDSAVPTNKDSAVPTNKDSPVPTNKDSAVPTNKDSAVPTNKDSPVPAKKRKLSIPNPVEKKPRLQQPPQEPQSRLQQPPQSQQPKSQQPPQEPQSRLKQPPQSQQPPQEPQSRLKQPPQSQQPKSQQPPQEPKSRLKQPAQSQQPKSQQPPQKPQSQLQQPSQSQKRKLSIPKPVAKKPRLQQPTQPQSRLKQPPQSQRPKSQQPPQEPQSQLQQPSQEPQSQLQQPPQEPRLQLQQPPQEPRLQLQQPPQPQQPEKHQKKGGSNEFPMDSSSSMFLLPPSRLSDRIQETAFRIFEVKFIGKKSATSTDSTAGTKPVTATKPGESKTQNFCKNPEYNPDEHCGVKDIASSAPCCCALTCSFHSIAVKRLVPGRSKSFDQLLHEYEKGNNPEKRKILPETTKSSDQNEIEEEKVSETSTSEAKIDETKNHDVVQPECSTIVRAEPLKAEEKSAIKTTIDSSSILQETTKSSDQNEIKEEKVSETSTSEAKINETKNHDVVQPECSTIVRAEPLRAEEKSAVKTTIDSSSILQETTKSSDQNKIEEEKVSETSSSEAKINENINHAVVQPECSTIVRAEPLKAEEKSAIKTTIDSSSILQETTKSLDQNEIEEEKVSETSSSEAKIDETKNHAVVQPECSTIVRAEPLKAEEKSAIKTTIDSSSILQETTKSSDQNKIEEEKVSETSSSEAKINENINHAVVQPECSTIVRAEPLRAEEKSAVKTTIDSSSILQETTKSSDQNEIEEEKVSETSTSEAKIDETKNHAVVQPECSTIVRAEPLRAEEKSAIKTTIDSSLLKMETLKKLKNLFDTQLKNDEVYDQLKNSLKKDLLKTKLILGKGKRLNLKLNTFPKLMALPCNERKSGIQKCETFLKLISQPNKEGEKILFPKLNARRSVKKRKKFPPMIASSSFANNRFNERLSIDRSAIDSESLFPVPFPYESSFITRNEIPPTLSADTDGPAEANNDLQKTDDETSAKKTESPKKAFKKLPKKIRKKLFKKIWEKIREKKVIVEEIRVLKELPNPNAIFKFDILKEMLECEEKERDQETELEQVNFFANNQTECKDEIDIFWNDSNETTDVLIDKPLVAGERSLDMKKVFTLESTMHNDKLLSGVPNIYPRPSRADIISNKKGLVGQCGEFLAQLDDMVDYSLNDPFFYVEQDAEESAPVSTDESNNTKFEQWKLPVLTVESIQDVLPEISSLLPPETVPVKLVPVFDEMNITKTDKTVARPVRVVSEVATQTSSKMAANLFMHQRSSYNDDSNSSDSIPEDVVDLVLEYEETLLAQQKNKPKNVEKEPTAQPVSVSNLAEPLAPESFQYGAESVPVLPSTQPSILLANKTSAKSANNQKQQLQPKVFSSASIPQPVKQSFYALHEANFQNPIPKPRSTTRKKTLKAQRAAENAAMFSRNRPMAMSSNPTIPSNAGGPGESTPFTAILCGPNDVHLQYDSSPMVDNAQPSTSSGTVGTHQMITIPIANDQPIMIPMNVAATGQAPQQFNTIASTTYQQPNNSNAHPHLVQMIQQSPNQNRIVGNVIAQQPLSQQQQQQQLNTIQCATLPGTATQAILLPISNLNSTQSIYILNPSGDTVNALSINPSSASLNTMIGVPSSNIQTATVAANNPIQLAKLGLSPISSTTTNINVPQQQSAPQNTVVQNHPELLQQLLGPSSSTASTSATVPIQPVQYFYPSNPH